MHARSRQLGSSLGSLPKWFSHIQLIEILIISMSVLLPRVSGESMAIFHLGNGSVVEMPCVQIIYQGGQQEPLDMTINGNITKDIGQTDGRIFMTRHPLATDDLYLDAQNKGALAILRLDPTYYVGGYLKYRFDNKDIIRQINAIIFEFGLEDTAKLAEFYDNQGIVNVTIIPYDAGFNPWDETFHNVGYFIWTGLLGAYSMVNICLAIWKMKLFVNFYGEFRVSIALFVLLLELLSNAIRLVAIVDLVSGNWIFSEKVSVAFSELSLPFTISAFMLLSLYWHEMMTSSTVVVHPFINKMRIPFFVLSGTLLALQLIRIFLRSWTDIEKLPFITATVYAIVTAALVIFYTITGIKLLKRLNKSKSLGRNVNLKRTSIKIMISAVFLLQFLIVAALFATGYAYYPIRYMVVWYANFTFLHTVSMVNILAFEVPRGSHSSSNTSPKTIESGTTLTSPRAPQTESGAHVL